MGMIDMSKLKLLPFVLYMFFSFCSGCGSPQTGSPTVPEPVAPLPTPKPIVPGNAPDFAGYSLSGPKIKLSDLQGRVVLLSFFASWCNPCMAALPDEKRLYERVRSQGVLFEIVGVSLDHSEGDARGTVIDKQIPWPVIWNAQNIAKVYRIESIPTFVLIDKAGDLAGRWTGGGHFEEIKMKIGVELLK